MDSLRIGTFTKSVLIDVARTTGRLSGSALEVDEVSVASSPAQFTSLSAGDYDGIVTSPDNVLAYRFLPGNPLGELLDVKILAALDRGLGLSVCARVGIADTLQLEGKNIGVDVPNSGFAFVAYSILERGGLTRADYRTVTLGSTPKRAKELMTGGCDATVLNAGNELRAQDSGCLVLGRTQDIGPYIGTVVAHIAQSPQQDALRRLVEVLLDVSRDICAGTLDAEVCESSMRLLGLTDSMALAHLACMKDPREGLIPTGVVDAPSIQTLVNLRKSYLPAPELDRVMTQLDNLVGSGARL